MPGYLIVSPKYLIIQGNFIFIFDHDCCYSVTFIFLFFSPFFFFLSYSISIQIPVLLTRKKIKLRQFLDCFGTRSFYADIKILQFVFVFVLFQLIHSFIHSVQPFMYVICSVQPHVCFQLKIGNF